jgi:hypothetical protein
MNKSREATFERQQTGWFSSGTTPPFAKKRANGTPPNLGGELKIAHSCYFKWNYSRMQFVSQKG